VRPTIIVLLILLLLQCGLAAMVYFPLETAQKSTPGTGLLQIEPGTVSEIHIADDVGNEVILAHGGERWLLPEMGDLPADGEKVGSMLRRLSPGTPGWPVAQTAAARQRFQVADYLYQRRIIFIGSDELIGTLYLGTSPGFRRVHARADGQQAVYSIDFNTFDAPAEAGHWLDRKLLQMRVLVSISGEAYDLKRDGETWVSGWGKEPDRRELLALLTTLQNLTVTGMADEDLQRELADLKPLLTLHLDSLSGEQTLEFYRLEGGHYVHSSRYDPFFGIGNDDFERLTTIDAERVMSGAPPPSAAEQP
jgi:hypothetical protein